MPKMLFALSFGFAALILVTQNAFAAATNCAARNVVLNQLASKYHESRRSFGLAANSAIMEIFAADDTGTWTITVTTPDGTTCLMASGDGYETLTESGTVADEPA